VSWLVVKIGSSSVTKETGPDPLLLASAMDAALAARPLGWGVILVSSGAVSSGLAYIRRTMDFTPSKRLAAAVGQPFLADIYRSISGVSGDHICQVLISESDLRSPSAMASVASVFDECKAAGIIPIVNGNDVTDLTGSDNDAVAVGIAVAVGADRLLLLTDVAGVFRGPPDKGRYLEEVSVAELRSVRFSESGTGRGGMRSKLNAAELAACNGIETHIAYARRPNVIDDCLRGQSVGTRVCIARPRFPEGKRWISGIAIGHGRVVINRSAEDSIKQGASLFASGIKSVRGDFRTDDIIDIVSPSGVLLARGSAKLSSRLMRLVRSMRTDEIAMVMTRILTNFQFGNKARKDRRKKMPSSNVVMRFQVSRAIEEIDSMSYERIRELAEEVILLFPSTTADAMLGALPYDKGCSLRDRYESLSSDLSLIDRRQLVVFQHGGPPSQPTLSAPGG
jgi:glutamate 5-kinase